MANNNLFDLSGKVRLDTKEFESAADSLSIKLDGLLAKLNLIEQKSKSAFKGVSYLGGHNMSFGGGSSLLGNDPFGQIATNAAGTAIGNIASDTVEGIGSLLGKLFSGKKENVTVGVNLELAEGTTLQEQVNAMVGDNVPVIPVSVVATMAEPEVVTQDVATWASELDLDFVEVPLVVSAGDVEETANSVNDFIKEVQEYIKPLNIPLAFGQAAATPVEKPETTAKEETSLFDSAAAHGVTPPEVTAPSQAAKPEYNGTWQSRLKQAGDWWVETFDPGAADAGTTLADIVEAAKKGEIEEYITGVGVEESLLTLGYLGQDASWFFSPTPESYNEAVTIGGNEYSYPYHYKPFSNQRVFGITPRDRRIKGRNGGGMNQNLFQGLATNEGFFSSVGADLANYEAGSTVYVGGIDDDDAINLLEQLQNKFPELNFEVVPEIPEEAEENLQSSLNGFGLELPVTPVISGSLGGYDWGAALGSADGSGPQPVNMGSELKSALAGMSVNLDDRVVGVMGEKLGSSMTGWA